MVSAILTDPTRALQGTNRWRGPAMKEFENDVGSLEQLLLYADEHYLAGKLPLGDHLGNVLHGVKEYHQLFTLADGAKQSFSLRGKNRLRIFTLRLTGGAHRYHCSRRKQKLTSDINKALTGGAQRTSLNQSPGDQSRRFSTADSCMRSAYDQSTLPIDVQVFHCKARDPHVEAWRVGCHLSCPPRHSTEVSNHTVYERRVRYTVLKGVHGKGAWI
ncbi:uncharacterized protein TNCV_1039911 [Trichonephila clavipes]|nr:uncharacterized protein TNCV_1039911 [Trichonephila clavipes]